MSLANYSDLKSAVANWLKRSDLSTQIPDFITLAEKKINRILDVSPMQVETQLNTAIGSDVIALPSDYQNPLAFWLNDINPRELLNQVTPDRLPFNSVNKRPLFWAIHDGSIRFDSPCDKIYPVVFSYIKQFSLSDSSPTNYILTEYPDVYLFGSLVEAAVYTMDDQHAALWQDKFKAAVDLANTNENDRNKYVPLRTEFSGRNSHRFSIYRGY